MLPSPGQKALLDFVHPAFQAADLHGGNPQPTLGDTDPGPLQYHFFRQPVDPFLYRLKGNLIDKFLGPALNQPGNPFEVPGRESVLNR